VKAQFKEDSPAWNSVIIKANETGWLFLEKYDNPVSKTGAVRLVRSFYEKANTKDILRLFASFTEHYNKLGAVAKVIQQPQSAGTSRDYRRRQQQQMKATKHGTRNIRRYCIDAVGLDTTLII
jgi:hypothetical protein